MIWLKRLMKRTFVITEPEKLIKTIVTPQEQPSKVWRFVKNQQPNEEIKLMDGTKLNFNSKLYVVTDENLANKIREVSDRFNIAEQ